MVSPAHALSDAPVLVHVERSGFVESVHHVLAVEVGADGGVTRAFGRVDAPVLPRSSNKPMQALAMVRHGLDLPPHLLATVCASHDGQDRHLDAVRGILSSAGLSESHLQNTPDLPLNAQARRDWLRAGRDESSLTQNCSGKHAGMLATCVAAGWPTDSYLDPGHPLQQAIERTLAELAQEEVAATGVDGCGAPVMAITLAGLARSLGAIAAAPQGSAERQVADAMREAPEQVGGTGRDVTELMRGVPGLVAKDGAEAVYAAGLDDGRGFAVKVADGGGRARVPVLAALLRSAGVEAPVLESLATTPVLGHGRPVGAVEVQGI